MGTIYLYPDKSAVIATEQNLSQQTAKHIRDQWNEWKDSGELIAVVLPGFDVVLVSAAPPPDTRLVLMSDELFKQLGSGRVEWGEPDEHGWYSPTIYTGMPPVGVN